MARYANPGGRDRIDAVVDRWRETCLVKNGSLFFDDRSLWTADRLEGFRRRFVDEAILGDATFGEKLEAQLVDADSDIRWLVAEVLTVYLLLASRVIGPAAKVKLVEDAIGTPVVTRPPHWDEVVAAFAQGIANPGPGYNRRRDVQIEYLLDFALRFKGLSEDARRDLLDDPWRLREFADATDVPKREMRHILLHLLRPEEFERIVSGAHKELIAAEFGPELEVSGLPLPTDMDERLFAIRTWLELRSELPHDAVLDFYNPPLVERWHPKHTQPTPPAVDDDEQEQTPEAPRRCFILNQREVAPPGEKDVAEYRDREGELYHWSSKSSGAWKQLSQSPGARFAYYRTGAAADGTAQHYFGSGRIGSIKELGPDEHGVRHWQANLEDYQRFDRFVRFADGPKGQAQTSIETTDEVAFKRLLRAGHQTSGGTLTVEAVRALAKQRGLLLDDATYAQVVAAINSGKHVIFTGPPGTAKTTLAQVVADVATETNLCDGYVLTTATADWTTYETIGGLRPQSDQTLQFEEGHFLAAIRAREWLVIDELNRSNFDRAFGQLFTVLSGQPVVLPYTRRGQRAPLTIVPSGAHSPARESDPLHIPSSWRVIATMNVFDKSLLFEMSYALMRRFAFIEIPSPSTPRFRSLIDDAAERDEAAASIAKSLLPLRRLRDLGPAVFLDIARYVRQRRATAPASDGALRFESFYSYLLPQFEGVSDEDARALYELLRPLVGDELKGRVASTIETVLGVELALGPATPAAGADDQPVAEPPAEAEQPPPA